VRRPSAAAGAGAAGGERAAGGPADPWYGLCTVILVARRTHFHGGRPEPASNAGGRRLIVPTLNQAQRDKLDREDFAYVDRDGGEHLPIHDASHVRNAIARFNQTHFESKTAREQARKRILAAARKFEIEVAEDDEVKHPA
jgi:hypothetical protein